MVAWAVDAVWDIECAQWDQFLCGAIWTKSDGNIRVFRDADGLADALMSLPPGAQAWAHSGGKYDVLWLIDYLASIGKMPRANVSMSGSSATSVKIKGGPWLRDSARLVPMSLARAAKIAGPNRSKGDPGIAYEDMHAKMTRAQWESVLRYLVSDVELLRDVLLAIADYSSQQGIQLRGTIGGTAWSTASKWCRLEDAEWDSEIYGLARPMYYGGLCAVGKTEASAIWRFDRKSAYPASLMESLPMGEPTSCDSQNAGRHFANGRHGAYDALVEIPESLAPSLPIRHRNRLAYPYGVVRGTWTGLELQHAVDCGAEVQQFYGAVVWKKEEARLAPYARKCFSLRDDLPPEQKEALGVWLKFLANSLTGKLGQSPDSKIVALGDFADDPSYELVGTSPWVWSKDSWRIPKCAMVHWAGTLTARARVELHKEILHAGDDWVYSDTDSCFATRQLERNVGDDLGDWAYEWSRKSKAKADPRKPNGANWQCKAPKVYAYDDLSTGEPIAHAKGVPGAKDGDHVAIDVWNRYTKGEAIKSDRGVKSLLTAARAGVDERGNPDARLFRRRLLSRSLHLSNEWCGARLRDGNVTRAPNVSDLTRLK
jgi:hypothetical protein